MLVKGATGQNMTVARIESRPSINLVRIENIYSEWNHNSFQISKIIVQKISSTLLDSYLQ